MSTIHLRQIRAHLETQFRELVDMSDLAGRSPQERENVFLSRSLAAFALVHFTNVDPQEAVAALTDRGQDNGIDAVLYHIPERSLYLVQSKWRHDGSGTISRGDVQKFPTGPLSEEVTRDIRDLLDEMNDPSEVVAHHVLRQGNLYAAVSAGSRGAPINLDVQLYDWGQVREPFLAYYGQVSASDVAQWWKEHYPRLFSPNIRMFLGETDVNESLLGTLQIAPENFWYFNNGITGLCARIQKKPIGGTTRDTGVFECHDLRIVNGAQTAGAIASAAETHSESVSKARVPITGRAYSAPAHSLPSAGGQGELLSSRFTPPPGGSFVGVMIGPEEDLYVLASRAGYGFVVKLGDLHGRDRGGKAVLNVSGSRPLAPQKVNDLDTDLFAAATNEGRLLIFPLNDLPVLPKGKGVKIMSIKGESLIGATPLPPNARLIVRSGQRYLNLKPSEWAEFTGNRALRGNKLPRGFQNVVGLEVG